MIYVFATVLGACAIGVVFLITYVVGELIGASPGEEVVTGIGVLLVGTIAALFCAGIGLAIMKAVGWAP